MNIMCESSVCAASIEEVRKIHGSGPWPVKRPAMCLQSLDRVCGWNIAQLTRVWYEIINILTSYSACAGDYTTTILRVSTPRLG